MHFDHSIILYEVADKCKIDVFKIIKQYEWRRS